MQKLLRRGPRLHGVPQATTGQTEIGGVGELHLDILVDRMKREFRVEANVASPRWPTARDRPKAVEKVDYAHSRRVAPATANALLRAVAPGRRGAVRVRQRRDRSWRAARVHPWTTASRTPCGFGILAGYPVVGVKATLVDGTYHDVDSSEMAFKSPAPWCWRVRAVPTRCC
ncbi:hypothetical protein QJS66_20365 [Kocuria rhizophila]|nr:hypothetical protein QJS66_20365 [Kocuria rhizophila]